jgi:TAG lipase / steryl ester hydrolase / phospholipase A2 / LPA acyltransferase
VVYRPTHVQSTMTQLLLPALRITSVPASDEPRRNPPPKATAAAVARPIRKLAVQPWSRAVRSAGNLLLYFKDGLTDSEREMQRVVEERKQVLAARLHGAETFSQWDAAAHELDALEGNEAWKDDNSVGDYNPDLIQDRLRALDEARTNCDLHAMMHLVRTALTRDLGGMGNIDLYRHSYCGTKRLIERYVDSALQTIDALVEQSAHRLPNGLETKDLLDAVLFSRQSFGRSALLLSGGGTFGMSHIGVLKAMFAAKLLPRIISGASAGSIVCAVVCTRTDDEVPELLREFPHGDLDVFEEEGNEDGIVDHLRRLLTEGNWSDIKHLTRVMRNVLGDMTFQEAYNRTRRICNICVSSASIYELPRLLNYVTAPNVMIWSAVAASCSVPLVFGAAPLLVKNPITGEHSPWNPTPQMWIDGSVDNDLPMTRLAEMFNVNHFIVSQVNPHVVPFLAREDAPYTTVPGARNQPPGGHLDWTYAITQLAKGEALHRMQILAEIGIFPNLVTKLRSILSQKYSGDINILPAIGILDLPRILKNPSSDFMLRACLLGERATWPKLSRIRDRCAIELALDRAVHALRARVVFSKSQVDLRRMVTGTNTNQKKRSHEPLTNLIPPSESISIKEKLRRRHRRSSGSNLHPVSVHRRHLDGAAELTDDDTGEEERLEMAFRRSPAKSRLKLKRLPSANPLQIGPRTTSYLPSSNEPTEFNFAKPPPPREHSLPEPPVTRDSVTPMHSTDTVDVDESPSLTPAEEASMTSPVFGATFRDGLETTDPYSSDADVDSHSDGSADAAIPPNQLQCSLADLDIPVVPDEWLHHMDAPKQHGVASREETVSPTPTSQQERGPQSSVPGSDEAGAGLWD